MSSIYIHIPFCLSKCSYCDFFSVKCAASVPDEYVSALSEEIKYRIAENNIKEISTVYIGGGTPSLLNESQLNEIFSSLKTAVITSDAEISIEVNPDDVTKELLDLYSKVGINRISCGIQTMNEEALKFVGRRASLSQNRKALEFFDKYWKRNLSLDLICGLPHETVTSFKSALKQILKVKPDHVSVYSLVIEDETPLGQYYLDNDYDYDFADNLWLECKKYLEKRGYKQYEVSNFCRKGKECKHNLVYWTHQDYIGCGSGGTGTVYDESGKGMRITNSKDLTAYCIFWNDKNKNMNLIPQEQEIIDLEDSKFEFFMMGLRKLTGITASQYRSCFNEDIPEEIVEKFFAWKTSRLCEVEKQKDGDVVYRFNRKGILYLNKFLQEL